MRTAKYGVYFSVLVLGAVTALAQGDKEEQRSGPGVDPAAIAALTRMGEFLRKQTSLEIKAVSSTDELLESGQAVQLGNQLDVLVRRPDHLRVNKVSERKTREFYYDGKTFTVYGPKAGYYAQVPAPPTIQQLVEVLARRYGIELPLADLFYWGTEKSGVGDIRDAVNVGPNVVEGAMCDHYAFRQRDVDWQIWVQQGAEPLPRKMIVTNVQDPARPQHQVVMAWTLNPKLDDKAFVFVPPKDALPIAIDDAEKLARSSRQGRTAPRPGGGKP